MFKNRNWALVAGFCLSLAAPSVVAGGIEAQMGLCAAVSHDGRRLECFDKMFIDLGWMEPSYTDQVQGHGRWIGIRNHQLRNRTLSSALALPADGVGPDEVFIAGAGYQDKPFLRVDCSHGGNTAFLHWSRDLGHNDIAIDFSFDGAPAVRQVWRVTLDGNIARPKSDRDEFLAQLWRSESMSVSIPRNGLRHHYDLTGFQGTANEMKDVCKWVSSM